MSDKRCSSCKIVKPFAEFHKGTAPDGAHTYCKVCMNLYYAERYEPKLAKMFFSNTHKQCRICLEIKEHSEFGKRSGEVLNTYCRSCVKHNSKGRNIASHGITVQEYLSMYRSQNGCCGICGIQHDNLSIDHDHSCCPGSRGCRQCVRGLVCKHCNTAMGFIKDNVDTVRKMEQYLSSGHRPFAD